MLRLGHAYPNPITHSYAEDIDIVMPKYNLLERSGNYPMTSGSLRNCYRDEMNDNANEEKEDKVYLTLLINKFIG